MKKRLPFLLVLFVAFSIYAYNSIGMQRMIASNMINLEERLSKLKDYNTNINGINVHYLDNRNTDAEETIVMIHGFGADTSNWPRFARPFTKEYRIIVPDLVGFGESDKPMALKYDYDSQATRVQQLVESLNIEKYHVVGNSMGGAITATLAYKYPKHVVSAGLFNPAGIAITDTEVTSISKKTGVNPLIPTDKAGFKKMMGIVMAKPPFIPWPVSNVKAQDAFDNAQMKQYVFSQIIAKAPKSIADMLPSIEQNTLVLWGDKDDVLHPDNANGFHRLLPNSTLHIMHGYGHLPMIESPKGSAKIYADFLNSI